MESYYWRLLRFDVETIYKATATFLFCSSAQLRFDVETIYKATSYRNQAHGKELRFDVETIYKATEFDVLKVDV